MTGVSRAGLRRAEVPGAFDVGAAAYWACVALGTAGVEGWAPVLAAAWHDRRVAAQVQSWLIPLFMLRHALLGR